MIKERDERERESEIVWICTQHKVFFLLSLSLTYKISQDILLGLFMLPYMKRIKKIFFYAAIVL